MAFRKPNIAPMSQVPPQRRGRVVGRFCHACGGVFMRHATVHRGKGLGLFTRDHVAAPCTYEGEPFEAGADWWEFAVELLPAPATEEAEETEETADSPA